LLERLRTAAEEGGRTGTLIEVLILQALAGHAANVGEVLGAPGQLDRALERALELAEPEGYVRTFVGEGAAITAPLEALVRRSPSWQYPRRLLAALRRPDEQAEPAGQPLVDPLSARELDVLRLLTTDLDGPAIARELVVSLNTVRSHTKSIYAKLGVNSRRAAVTRAGDLGLLARLR
jgi:LuxR family maltose regulon positive regulatory protein